MRILYLHRTQGEGAEGNHIREVVSALRIQGHDVDVLSPPGVDPFHEADEQQVKKGALPRKILKMAAQAIPQFCFECMEIAYNIYALQKLREYLKAKTPDFIYERYAFFCSAPSKISKRRGIPHILEVNEISGIKRQRQQTMKDLCGKYEKELFQNVSAIIVVSDFLRNAIIARHIAPDKITVMPNAINPKDFSLDINVSDLRKSLFLEGKIVITFVGMFASWDRLEVMLDSFARIKQKCPEAHFIIVGEGGQRSGLMAQAKALGLEADITFTGKVSRKDVARHIALSDLCVLYGSNPFGSPMALFEYMALGKPVVAPGYGPVTSIVEHGVQGLIFTPDDQQQFVNHVIELLRSKERRRGMGSAARARIEGQFTWTSNAKKILKIYENMKHNDNL